LIAVDTQGINVVENRRKGKEAKGSVYLGRWVWGGFPGAIEIWPRPGPTSNRIASVEGEESVE